MPAAANTTSTNRRGRHCGAYDIDSCSCFSQSSPWCPPSCSRPASSSRGCEQPNATELLAPSSARAKRSAGMFVRTLPVAEGDRAVHDDHADSDWVLKRILVCRGVLNLRRIEHDDVRRHFRRDPSTIREVDSRRREGGHL